MSGKVLKSRKKRGLTPVISTIILSAVVIAVGGGVWAYAQGAATIFAENYVNETMSMLDEVIERYSVEHVSNNSNGNVLYVWIYNHGEVDIVVDIYANATRDFNSTLGTAVASGNCVKIEVHYTSNPLQEGDEVSVKAHSRRQNNAYYTYYAS